MKHFLLAFSLIFLLASTLSIAKDSKEKPIILHMEIEGMTCSMCAKTTKDAIIKAVTDAGYTVTERHEE